MQALSHIFFVMMSKMEPRELLQQLMDRDGLNSSSLAARLGNATTQPQIHKFLSGKAKEPKRSTLAPIATHFRIPLDALYDPIIADVAAKQKNLTAEGVGNVKPVPRDINALTKIYNRVPAVDKLAAIGAAMQAMAEFLPDDSSPAIPQPDQADVVEKPSSLRQAERAASKTP